MTRAQLPRQARAALSAVIVALALIGGGTARAGNGADRTAIARDLFALGMGRFQLGEYDAAIASWEEGFRNKPAPEFLYNIAQAHRRAHRPDQALVFLQKYLRASPDAANRAEVERLIATLEHTPAPPAAAPAPAAVAPSPDPVGPHDAVAEPASPSPATDHGSRPLLRKPWFWAAVGGGVAVVTAAIVVGVVVGGRSHDSAQQLPAISFGLRF